MTTKQIIKKCHLIRAMQSYHGETPNLKDDKCNGYKNSENKLHKICVKCKANNDIR